MASKLTENDVSKWFSTINLALEWRKPYEDIWDRVIDYLKGRYFNEMSDSDRICVNMVRPHVNVVVPAIYSRNPDVIVRPQRRWETETDELVRKRAEVMQNLLRYYLKELDLKTEIKLCILDAVMTGHSWVKTGYELKLQQLQEEASEKETVISKVLKMVGLKEDDPVENDEPIINEKILSERPWALRVSPYDMIVPALSRRPEELSWMSNRIIMTLDEAREKYDNEKIKPSANGKQLLAGLRGSKYKDTKVGDDIDFAIVHEIWHRDSQCRYVLIEGNEKAIEDDDSDFTFLDSGYHPFIQLRFNEIIDEFYPQGDIESAEPQILELNNIRTMMSKHIKRYNRRYISRPSALDPSAKADLVAGEDGVVVEVSHTYSEDPIDSVVSPIKDASITQDAYAVEARVKDDIFTILGTSDYASKAQGGARTATEASIIATQSRFRVEERIDLISEFVGKIIRNLAMISQKYMDSQLVGSILGVDGLKYWQQLEDDDEIKRQFAFDVIYGSTTPINKELDREQYQRFYAMTKDDPYIDQVKLRLNLIRKQDLENPESWLMPQIAQQLDMQRLAAVKMGLLLGTPQNALGASILSGKGQGQGGAERLPTGQPRGMPGDLGEGPELPGGTGGTQLAGGQGY